jgi:hypothetical protein
LATIVENPVTRLERSKVKYTTCLTSIFLLCSSFAIADQPKAITTGATESGVTVLYDGGDLSGWKGRADLWSAENGEIVGRTVKGKPIKGNTFLIWEGGQPDNFELTAQFKIEGGNSGIQYRSKVVDEEKSVVGGYQADIDFGNRYAGILYEEKGRGILAERGQKVTIKSDGSKNVDQFGKAEALGTGIHPGQWNDFRVVADGNHLQHFINDTMTMEVIDQQSDKAATSGVIALQVHAGPPMTVRFKNIKIRSLK